MVALDRNWIIITWCILRSMHCTVELLFTGWSSSTLNRYLYTCEVHMSPALKVHFEHDDAVKMWCIWCIWGYYINGSISNIAGSVLPFWGNLVLLEPNFTRRKSFHFKSILRHKLQTNQAQEADQLASYCRIITERCLVLARELCYKEEWLNQSMSKSWLAWTQVGS